LIKFSIVLAVRTAGHVQECVERVLAQTYPHFDLIVLDNQSTDNTMSWLKTLKDDRIRLFSSQALLSVDESWGRTVRDVRDRFGRRPPPCSYSYAGL
jgi:glycosyltransferase involved in cell wall biosynthesis